MFLVFFLLNIYVVLTLLECLVVVKFVQSKKLSVVYVYATPPGPREHENITGERATSAAPSPR